MQLIYWLISGAAAMIMIVLHFSGALRVLWDWWRRRRNRFGDVPVVVAVTRRRVVTPWHRRL